MAGGKVIVPVPALFAGSDVADVLARNFARNAAGTEIRMPNAAPALQSIANAINFGLGMPRILAVQSRDASNAFDSSSGADPLWLFRYVDRHANGRRVRVHLLTMPRLNAPGAPSTALAHRYGDTADTTPALATGTDFETSETYPTDISHHSFIYERGDKADAAANIGVTVTNGAVVCGIVIQDEPLSQLERDLDHDYAPLDILPGSAVLADKPEAIRAALQALREDYMPCEWWYSANDCMTGTQPSTSSAADGLVITGDAYVNLLDGASTTRTATTPGASMHVQHAGHGPASTEGGKRVLHNAFVLAETDDEEAYVQMEGSSTFASNTDSASIASGGPAWYALSTGVYSDASKADDDATTARNKIDFFGKCASAAGTNLWVYGIAVYRVHI